MNPTDQELYEREQKVFARLGRLTFLVDQQGEALQQANQTMSQFEAFLEKMNLREDFNKFVESQTEIQNGSLADAEAVLHEEPANL